LLESVFKRLDVNEIVEELAIILKVRPAPNKNQLLFLDEIQAVPSAIQALRYFYEEMPELSVIAAGSLLEFTLSKHNYSMPVGRIEYLFLGPLTFNEFLSSQNENYLLDYISDYTFTKVFSNVAHEKLLRFLKQYFIIGGMPEAVNVFRETGDMFESQKVHHSILNTYEDD